MLLLGFPEIMFEKIYWLIHFALIPNVLAFLILQCKEWGFLLKSQCL